MNKKDFLEKIIAIEAPITPAIAKPRPDN